MFVPLPSTSIQLSPQLTRDGLQMHEVAEATTSAFPVREGNTERLEQRNIKTSDIVGVQRLQTKAGTYKGGQQTITYKQSVKK